jgi:hypothetical protein
MKASELYAFNDERDNLQHAVQVNLRDCAHSVLNTGEVDKDAIRETYRYLGIMQRGDTVYMPLEIAALNTYSLVPLYANILFRLTYHVPRSMLQSVAKTRVRMYRGKNNYITIEARVNSKWIDMYAFDWEV